MVKSDSSHVVGWPAPRGRRTADGAWELDLDERLPSDCVGRLEAAAVANYQELVGVLRQAQQAGGWSIRTLASASGLGVATTSDAMSGSSWPRWATLAGLASAFGMRLETADDPRDPIVVLLELLDDEPELTGLSVARDVVIRPNTLYDLRKQGKSPSSATVLVLAAWADNAVVLAAS